MGTYVCQRPTFWHDAGITNGGRDVEKERNKNQKQFNAAKTRLLVSYIFGLAKNTGGFLHAATNTHL
ncbi:hypothetical protein FACS1894170_02630 [Planctomycetales bacterium]|nr:hypothetical protein FACS1894170_02630 [Planctomycetales bacterium]